MRELSEYEQIIYELSEQIVLAQKPIRILDAIKWGTEVEEYFFQNHFKKLPEINQEYYQKVNPLSFDPIAKTNEFHEIERNIRRKLGQYSGAGSIMQRMCQEYRNVIELLMARGTSDFTEISKDLYGSSEDVFHVGAPTLKDLGLLVSEIIVNLKDQLITEDDSQIYSSEETVAMLAERLKSYFLEKDKIRVLLSDGIVADAAAGADKIKVREGLNFSLREIRTFEIHEGWVHLGTTLNGMAQPICTFLSKGPPSSTVTQEGLAIITEIFTFSSYPKRLQRLTNRILAVNMAEEGANFYDVFQFYRDQGMTERDGYQSAVRVFRGSSPEGGPFTKDLAYSKGFILIYNFMRLAVQQGLVKRIPLLFIGKTTLDDLPILAELLEEGILVPPRYVPPQFADIAAVAAWMAYSLFLNRLDLKRLALDFKGLLL